MTQLSERDLLVTALDVVPVDVPLFESFTISKGSLSVAGNAFVCVALQCGAVGYGECAPFPQITGEDQAGTLAAGEMLREIVVGGSASAFRRISRQLTEAAPHHPAARCGVETAILDALCRSLGIPMWQFLGGATSGPHETDITIPICAKERSLELAEQWWNRGFRIIKVKVGRDLDGDLGTITAIAARHPGVSFVIDANQAFDETESVSLVRALRDGRVDVRLIEQPIPRSDIDALARLRALSPFPIAADESVATCRDAAEVYRAGAADVVNIKIMKSGVVEAIDIAHFARGCGLGIMLGGMMETRLAMGCSLAIAAGIGPVHTLDLDTPLLMAVDPLEGGYTYEGALMYPSPWPGLGIAPKIGF